MRVSPSFWLVISGIIFLNFYVVMLAVVCSFVHEVGHLLALGLLKVKINKIYISLFGGRIDCDISSLNPICKALVYLAGPVFSMIFGIFALLWCKYRFSVCGLMLFVISFVLGICNLLPVSPLDGYGVLTSFLKNKKSTEIIEKLFAFLILITGVKLWLFNDNFALLLFGSYLIICRFNCYFR